MIRISDSLLLVSASLKNKALNFEWSHGGKKVVNTTDEIKKGDDWTHIDVYM